MLIIPDRPVSCQGRTLCFFEGVFTFPNQRFLSIISFLAFIIAPPFSFLISSCFTPYIPPLGWSVYSFGPLWFDFPHGLHVVACPNVNSHPSTLPFSFPSVFLLSVDCSPVGCLCSWSFPVPFATSKSSNVDHSTSFLFELAFPPHRLLPATLFTSLNSFTTPESLSQAFFIHTWPPSTRSGALCKVRIVW